MRKSFALNTEPHIAEIGGTELRFEAEVMGDEFMDAFYELRTAQQEKGLDLADIAEAEPSAVRHSVRALRVFIARQMLPESAELFTRLDVVRDGEVLGTFGDLDEAEEFAGQHAGSRITDAFRLPTRVLVELLEWVVELYGGGDRPTMSSSASATASRRAGTRGSGSSPSKASTRTRGR